MIGHLRGHLLHQNPPHLLLDVNGVAYELEAPMTTFYALPPPDQTVSLFVHLIVREDALRLFGFSDQPQRELFRCLLKVGGIGPRAGLAILSTLTVAQVITCVRRDDANTLTRVPGIGPKTAERMLIDLRDRIHTLGPFTADSLTSSDASDSPSPTDPTTRSPDDPVQDAISALLALGYKPAAATRAIRAATVHLNATATTATDTNPLNQPDRREQLIRHALQSLSKA